MQAGLLYQLNTLIAGNQRLMDLYKSIYYLLPAKESDLINKVWSLFEKREELDLKLKKCSFNIRNQNADKHCSCGNIIKYMPFFLWLEKLARSQFKDTKQHWLYLEEKKFLQKYFELLYKRDLSDRAFELLIKYKRKERSIS
ncbi:MAG: hypothetical protein R3259_05235 [Salinimicrobium sediminis]|nr:hypothetical protein [Salinimicrobium sediminis]